MRDLRGWLRDARTALPMLGMNRRLISLAFGEVGATGLTVLAFAYLARIVGEAGFGQISWAQAIVAYAAIPADFGLAALGTREIARRPASLGWYLSTILLLRLLLSGIVIAAVIGLSFTYVEDVQLRWILIAAHAWLVLRMLNPEWVIQGLQRVEVLGLTRLATGLLLCVIVVVWAKLSGDVVLGASTRTLAELVAVVGNLAFVVFWVHSIRHPVGGLPWWQCLQAAAPLMLSSLFTSLYAANFDTILIGLYRPPEHVAWYTAAYRFYMMLTVLPKLGLVLYYPRFASGHAEGGEHLQEQFRQYLTLCLLYGLPVVAATFVLAPEMLVLLYGSSFAVAALPLQILALGAVALVLAAGMPSMLMATGHPGQALICFGAAMVLNVGLNLVSIPIWGERAAALTTAVSETAVLLISFTLVRRHLGVHPPTFRFLALRTIPALAVLIGAIVAKSLVRAIGLVAPLSVLAIVGSASMMAWGIVIVWLARWLRRSDVEAAPTARVAT